MLAQGVGKVPKSLVLGCAGFSSLRLMPNQLGVSKVGAKGTGLRSPPKALLVQTGQGLPVWQGEGNGCAVMLACPLETDQDLWRWLPLQIGRILAPTHPQIGLEQARNTASFPLSPLGVTLEKLLFAHLHLRRSMSSPRACPCSYVSHSNGRVWDWASSPEMVGLDKKHHILPMVTHRLLSAD